MAQESIGQNIKLELKGDTAIITIKLTERLGTSSSGKSTIVATTSGNVAIPGYEDVKLGINAYVNKQK